MNDGMQPVGLALIVCDAIYQDPATGKRTLLGIFSAMYASEFPAIVPSLAVYAVLTEYQGAMPLVIRVIDVNEAREPVATDDIEVDTTDPLTVVEMDIAYTNLEFPAAGEYRVQLLAGGAIVLERKLILGAQPNQPSAEEDGDEQ